jgi:Tol biopolymer transport system component
VLALGVIVIGILVTSILNAPFSPRVLKVKRLTHDQLSKALPLFTDGPRLYFGEFISSKPILSFLLVDRGEVAHIPVPFEDFAFLNGVPDGSGVFVAADQHAPERSFWKLPLPGGSPVPIGKLGGLEAVWSPDGRYVAYTVDGEKRTLYVAKGNGTNPQQIFTLHNNWIECPQWAPDGRSLRFGVMSESQVSSLWEVGYDGSDPHEVLPNESLRGELCGSWTPDGKYYVFTSFRNNNYDLWALRERRSWWLPGRRKLARLTNGALEFLGPIASLDGKRIFALGVEHDAELVRYDDNSQDFKPYLGGISAGRVDFSRDGKWITYIKHPERTLWRRRVEGGDELQLTFAPLEADGPHWSPDGERIAFLASSAGQPRKVFVIPSRGGIPEEVWPENKSEEGIPTWSPDGNFLAFGELRWHPDKIAIHIADLRNKKVSTVPGSQGLWTPRWSPDGRYLLALTADASSSNSKSLLIYDFRKSQWRKLIEHLINEPVWSHDGEYIYFDVAIDPPKNAGIFRVSLSDGKLEQVASLENFHRASQVIGDWLGLAPDDSPLLLRDRRNTEVYALDVEW